MLGILRSSQILAIFRKKYLSHQKHILSRQKHIRALLVILFTTALSFLSQPLLALAIEPYQATYSLRWHGITVGTSTHTIHIKDSNRFLAEITSKPILSFLPFKSYEKSHFTLFENNIRPIQYQYQTQEKKKNKEGEIWFNWQTNTITKQIAKTSPIVEPLLKNALDKITVYFQLQKDLLLEKKFFEYTIIEPQKTSNYVFNVIQEEVLKTKIGTLNTVKLEHLSPNQERLTTIWLAKDKQYLIVKLEQRKHGKLIATSIIKSYEN